LPLIALSDFTTSKEKKKTSNGVFSLGYRRRRPCLFDVERSAIARGSPEST